MLFNCSLVTEIRRRQVQDAAQCDDNDGGMRLRVLSSPRHLQCSHPNLAMFSFLPRHENSLAQVTMPAAAAALPNTHPHHRHALQSAFTCERGTPV
ncbi:hypothetical protein TIFTF001_016519 [Ficus carica]|uniref:Uncharacterized protein n=1 Tax=Ficus carica TaxID=3494 RepID=A0AA88D9Y3_FICCA|nr:hypothetical protein TIFTF001_016519 [Ficus carica]